jgi:hypothetical protein
MAVHDGLPGVSVCINVAGRPCNEYLDPDHAPEDQPNTVVRYIESRPGAAFAISISITTGLFVHCKYPMGAHVYIDGARTNMRVFTRSFTENIAAAEDIALDGRKVTRGFFFTRTRTEIGIGWSKHVNQNSHISF